MEPSMIAEIILGLINIGLLIYMAWERRETRREQSKLINALVSTTPEQLRDLELTDKVKPIKTDIPNPEPDFVHESEMPQDVFEKMIEKEVS